MYFHWLITASQFAGTAPTHINVLDFWNAGVRFRADSIIIHAAFIDNPKAIMNISEEYVLLGSQRNGIVGDEVQKNFP